MSRRTSGGRALDLPSLLAYLYQPVLPVLKKVRVRRAGTRGHNPRHILVPPGYAVELVATGLNAPVHCCFDAEGFCYVSECGHKIDAKPRIVQVDVRTGDTRTFFELPEERWNRVGAFTGACWHAGALYFLNTGTASDAGGALSRLLPDGRIEDLVTGLPWGDHQPNHPVVGPDGRIYFGVGSVTNCGVVGADNAAYEWLPQLTRACDVPARDVTLAGQNFEFRNVLGDVRDSVRSGAYVPFGRETHAGQVIRGDVKCTGSILRCNPDGSGLEVVAWGLRNPYGLAFHPDGRLFATEHGMDERGGRFIVGDGDDLYAIEAGRWYGWPDFASGVRLDDPAWGEGGQGRDPVLAAFPEPAPPRPVVTFESHAAANGLDFCRDAAFGFAGDAFVALFGDLAPVTTPRLAAPVGFKVVRVDVETERIVDFAVNRIAGPASKLPHEGFERPSHCAFGPDGALYVVDWGEIEIAPEAGGIRMQQGTGTLWRIRRTEEPAGTEPPKPLTVPLYTGQYLLWGLGALGFVAGAAWLGRRVLRARRR